MSCLVLLLLYALKVAGLAIRFLLKNPSLEKRKEKSLEEKKHTNTINKIIHERPLYMYLASGSGTSRGKPGLVPPESPFSP